MTTRGLQFGCRREWPIGHGRHRRHDVSRAPSPNRPRDEPADEQCEHGAGEAGGPRRQCGTDGDTRYERADKEGRRGASGLRNWPRVLDVRVKEDDRPGNRSALVSRERVAAAEPVGPEIRIEAIRLPEDSLNRRVSHIEERNGTVHELIVGDDARCQVAEKSGEVVSIGSKNHAEWRLTAS